MGVDLSAAIPSGSLVVIDSAPIIYFLEDHRTLAPRFAPLFERASAGDIDIAIAAITLAEVLTGPLGAGNEVLAETYRTALTQGQGWSVVPETEQIAVNAARFRARYRLKLPDALQVATVLATGAYALITHDRDFRTVRDVRVMG
jgi:predicted nucleic acid-binding protein